LTLKPTLSPGRPSTNVSWCISTLSLVISRVGVPLDFSGDVGWGKGNNHTSLDDTSFNTADGYSSNTTDFVDILERETEGFIGRSDGGFNRIDGFKEGEALGRTSLGLLGPSLEPGHVGRLLNHVVAVPSGDGDESNSLGIISNLFEKVGSLLDDLLIAGFRPFGRIHLIDRDDDLSDTKGVSKQSMLTGLSILGNTSFKLTNTSGNDDYNQTKFSNGHTNTAISLRSSRDHVLDEITMSGGVNDSDIELGSLKLPESDVDGDASLTLGL
jgi:hypothetical protein